jgi:hypothetical protein
VENLKYLNNFASGESDGQNNVAGDIKVFIAVDKSFIQIENDRFFGYI